MWLGLAMMLAAACASTGDADTPATPPSLAANGSATGSEVGPAPSGTDPTSETGNGSEFDVDIEIFQFGVEELTVTAGDTVRWNNKDQIVHTVTSGSRTYGDLGVVTATEIDDLFDFSLDGRDPDGASAEYVFDRPGFYSMICTIHPGIDMTVEVTG